MLALSEGELAELIIHELTHSTIYLKDSVNFNEI
jgi:predicted aminopeptidase